MKRRLSVIANHLLSLLLLGFLGLAACATNHAAKIAAPTTCKFHDYSIDELMSHQLKDAPAIRIEIPALYKPHKPLLSTSTVWSLDDDWKQLSKHRDSTTHEGFVVAQFSENLGYDASRDLFYTANGDETSLLSDMVSQGWRNVNVKRGFANGSPVLIVEAGEGNGIQSRMMYISIKNSRHTIFIHYHCRQPWTALDDVIWQTMKDSLLAAKKK